MGDNFWIKSRTSRRHSHQGLYKVTHISDAVFQQVTDPSCIICQQLSGIASLDVLGEHQDPESLVKLTKFDCRSQSFVGEAGGHANVHDHYVRTISFDRLSKAMRLTNGVYNLKSSIDQ